MSVPETAERTEVRRLDPFALPSSTTSRFLILILATTAGALYLSKFLITLWWWAGDLPEQVRLAGCLTELRAGAAAVQPVRLADRYGDCTVGVTGRETLLLLALTAAPIVLALSLYAAHPLWLRRHGPEPLDDPAAPEHDPVALRFREIVAEETPGRRVRILVDYARGGVTGRAFGLPGRPQVVISLGLVTAHDERPEIAEAVLRHELAHIRNRDLGIAYLTVAIWWAFLASCVMPSVVAAAIWLPSALPLLALQLPVILSVLWLARTSVLRAREHHADVRAGDTPDRKASMAAAVETASWPSHRRGPFRFLSNHPRRRDRLSVLDQPGALLRLGWWEMLATGLLAGLTFTPVFEAARFLDFEVSADVQYHLSGLVFGSVVSGIVVVSVWRAGAGRIAGDDHAPRLWRASAGVTIGVLLGLLMTPPLSGASIWHIVLGNPPLILAYAALLLLVLRTYLGWAAACARGRLPASRRLRRTTLAGAALAAFVIGPWLGHWFQGILLIAQAGNSWSILTIMLVTGARNMSLILAVTVAGWYLLGPAARRRLSTGGPLRLHLDDDRPAIVPLRSPRVLRALCPPLLACAVMAVGGVALHPMLTEASRHKATGDFLAAAWVTIGMAAGLLALSALAIGIMMGGRHRTSWALAHVCAGVLVACAPMTLVTLVHIAWAECGREKVIMCLPQGADPALTFGNHFTLIYGPALFGGLLLAAAGSGLRAVRPPAAEPAPRIRSPRVRIATSAATVVITVVVAASGYGVAQNWLPALGVVPAPPVTFQAQVVNAAGQPVRPGTVSQLDACRYASSVFASPAVRDGVNTDQRYYLLAIQLFHGTASSDDPALRALAAAGYAWFGQGRAGMITKTVTRILHYCTLVGFEHQVTF